MHLQLLVADRHARVVRDHAVPHRLDRLRVRLQPTDLQEERIRASSRCWTGKRCGRWGDWEQDISHIEKTISTTCHILDHKGGAGAAGAAVAEGKAGSHNNSVFPTEIASAELDPF